MDIAISLLSIKDILESKIKLIDELNFKYIHLDIMDGVFVPPKTWNYSELSGILKNINTKLDVHLMVSDVKSYIDDYIKLNPEYITFHLEVGNTLELINYIKGRGIKVGISINPETKVEELIPYLSMIDLVLIMSVTPGYGGTEFIIGSEDKLRKLKELNNYNFKIEVDGGINIDTIENCKDADILVVGSAITLSEDYKKAKENLENKINEIR